VGNSRATFHSAPPHTSPDYRLAHWTLSATLHATAARGRISLDLGWRSRRTVSSEFRRGRKGEGECLVSRSRKTCVWSLGNADAQVSKFDVRGPDRRLVSRRFALEKEECENIGYEDDRQETFRRRKCGVVRI